MKTILLSVLVTLINAAALQACGISPQLYAGQILSANNTTASNAIVALRHFGQQGLSALFEAHQELIAKHDDQDPQWQRLRKAIEAVGGQRDCHVSRLFWHKSLDDAQAEAKRTGRPILSLRLLGNLDEELSCANSRFFRTTLYANKEVSDYLRDHFVLHWKSVRPVPHITVDFGDGRTIERTITGNSIHYVLDSDGVVIDALPGLYGVRAFLSGLQGAEQMALQVAKSESTGRKRLLERYHVNSLRDINDRWSGDIAQVRLEPRSINANGTVRLVAHPAAAAAMPLTASKARVEQPMLRALTPRREALEQGMDDQVWAKLGALHTNDVVLDQSALALIRAKLGREDYFQTTIKELERSIAEDTVRNEYSFHSRIHEWLGTRGASYEVDVLNSRVYAELFLTPETDPWLGLAPQTVFSALEHAGVKERPVVTAP